MRLSDVCELIVDCPHSTSPDEGYGYPLIRTPNIGKGRLMLEGVHRVSEKVYHTRTQRAVPQDDDLIFAREAPAGNIAIIKNGEKVCLGQRTVLIRPDKTKVFPDFLVYYLLSPQQQYHLLKSASGATVPHVNLPNVRNLHIKLPPYSIQQKIAGILSVYDDLIENNNRQIKLLEEAAQRLYKEWFVDLRFPGHETTKIVDGVPEGWEKVSFSSKVSIMSGGTPKTTNKSFYNGTIPFYTPKDHPDNFFVFDTALHISRAGLSSCNSDYYPEGTIIITARGTVGKTVLLGVPMAMNQSCYALKSDSLCAPYYLFFSLNQEVAKLKTMANGGVFDTIIVKTFDSINITIPSNELHKKFEYLVTEIMEKIKKLLQQNEALRTARSLLLPRLMKGQCA